jgi:hypothetical protein
LARVFTLSIVRQGEDHLTTPDAHHVLMAYHSGITMRAAISRTSCVILTIAISGCNAVGQPPPTLPAAVPVAFSFDGTYTGTIRLTSSGASANPHQANWCDTPPQISLTIHNNAFTYQLTRPGLSLTLAANVAPDGTITGSDVNGEAVMDGLIGGSQIAGHINGTACNYTFTANEV